MLTRQGLAVLAAALALYLLALWLGYAYLFGLALGLLLAPLVGLVFLLRSSDYQVQRAIVPGDRVARGDDVTVTLTLANRTGGRQPRTEVIEPVGMDARRLVVPRLPRGGRVEVSYVLDAPPRGRYRLGPLAVDRSDPFGLVASVRTCGEASTLIVHPRLHAIDPIASGRLRDLDGPAVDKALEGTVTFHGLREYVVGDDRRHIHWRSSARTGTLMVRQHVDVSEPRTAVVLDTESARYQAESFEVAVEVAASLVAASGRHGCPVVLIDSTGARLTAGRDGAVTPLLDALAGVHPTEAGGLARVAGTLRSEEPGTSLVAVTGRLDRADLAMLAAARRGFDSVVAIVVPGPDPDPTPQPPAGVRALTVTSGEEFARAWTALR